MNAAAPAPTVADPSAFVRRRADGAARLELVLDRADCAACVADVEGVVAAIPGVLSARLNVTDRRLSVDWQGDAVDPAAVLGTLTAAGYEAYPFEPGRPEAAEAREMRRLVRAMAVAGFAAMNVMLLSVSVWAGNASDITPETRDLFHWISALIALPAAAVAGEPFFASALAALRRGTTNMDVPISIGVALALGVSVYETATSGAHAYFDSALMLLFFLLAGRVLDQAMRRRTRAAAANLAALRTETATRIAADGSLAAVPARALVAGDTVLVRPGERVPADGTVLTGLAAIDESGLTGETAPRRFGPGDSVHAGALALDAALTVAVRAAGPDTLIAEIERLLSAAGDRRGAYVRLADRAARLYAPVVHATAALAAIGWLIAGASLHDALLIAVAVLIITCPCALALAVPAVQVVAAGALFRRGVLLASGDALERLASVDTVVFDKTGTLTLPEPQRIVSFGGGGEGTAEPGLATVAARLALSSRHPLAAALAGNAAGAAPFDGVTEEAGRGVRTSIDGVEARLGSPAFCDAGSLADAARTTHPTASLIAARVGDRRAVFAVPQALRADARATVAGLAAAGFDVRVLSGDRPEAVAPVAAALGLPADAAQGGLTPAAKVSTLEALRAAGRRVLMVGDGLNDAPALAAADVSLAPITAVDLIQGHADAVWLGRGLGPVAETLAVARRARRRMAENLGLAVVYNLIAVPLAVCGFVTPLVAALAMSGSSLIVTLNALRDRAAPAPRLGGAAPNDGAMPAPPLASVPSGATP
jgi:Cu2+-exporting ATPase